MHIFMWSLSYVLVFLTVGERSRNSKFSYVSPRSIYGETSNEGKESASTYPCRLLSGSVQENGVEGVVLVVIQITDDQAPNGRHLRVQHTHAWGKRLLLLDPARGRERLMEIQQHDGAVVEAAGISAGLRQALSERERCYKGRGRRQGLGCGSHAPPHYI